MFDPLFLNSQETFQRISTVCKIKSAFMILLFTFPHSLFPLEHYAICPSAPNLIQLTALATPSPSPALFWSCSSPFDNSHHIIKIWLFGLDIKVLRKSFLKLSRSSVLSVCYHNILLLAVPSPPVLINFCAPAHPPHRLGHKPSWRRSYILLTTRSPRSGLIQCRN